MVGFMEVYEWKMSIRKYMQIERVDCWDLQRIGFYEVSSEWSAIER